MTPVMASLKVKYNVSVASDLSCCQYWIYTKYWRKLYRPTGMCSCKRVLDNWETSEYEDLSRTWLYPFHFMLPDSTAWTERRWLKEGSVGMWLCRAAGAWLTGWRETLFPTQGQRTLRNSTLPYNFVARLLCKPTDLRF